MPTRRLSRHGQEFAVRQEVGSANTASYRRKSAETDFTRNYVTFRVKSPLLPPDFASRRISVMMAALSTALTIS